MPVERPRTAPAISARGTADKRSKIMVTVRVRPESQIEREGDYRSAVRVLDEHVLCFDPMDSSYDVSKGPFSRKPKDLQFAFDKVFDTTATQQEVYEGTSKMLIEPVLNGFNATVFAYGATGAGKTHTMLGNDEAGPGVMMLTLTDLFKQVEDLSETSHFVVKLSYLEVYNERIKDLLDPETEKVCALREDAKRGMIVSNLTMIDVADPTQIMRLLHRGNQHRSQSPTEANATSSRSHAVLQIHIERQQKATSEQTEKAFSKLSLIDLAGSERAARTKNRGIRLLEGANINRSLLALSNCINALSQGKKHTHVPFRDSKLTRMLKDSLGGSCYTLMIANISPSSYSYEDTHNTLKYAERAKRIKVRVKRNVHSVSFHVSKYKQVIKEQKSQIQTLKYRIGVLEAQLADANAVDTAIENAERERTEEFLQLIKENFRRVAILKDSVFDCRTSIYKITEEIKQKKLRMTQWKHKNPGCPIHDTPVALRGMQVEITALETRIQELSAKKQRCEEKLSEYTTEFRRIQEMIPVEINSEERRRFLAQEIKIRASQIDYVEATRVAKHNSMLLTHKTKEVYSAQTVFAKVGNLISKLQSKLDHAGLLDDDLDIECDSALRLCTRSFEPEWLNFARDLLKNSPSKKLRSPSVKDAFHTPSERFEKRAAAAAAVSPFGSPLRKSGAGPSIPEIHIHKEASEPLEVPPAPKLASAPSIRRETPALALSPKRELEEESTDTKPVVVEKKRVSIVKPPTIIPRRQKVKQKPKTPPPPPPPLPEHRSPEGEVIRKGAPRYIKGEVKDVKRKRREVSAVRLRGRPRTAPQKPLEDMQTSDVGMGTLKLKFDKLREDYRKIDATTGEAGCTAPSNPALASSLRVRDENASVSMHTGKTVRFESDPVVMVSPATPRTPL